MAPKFDTWIAFYIGDYLADTMHLSREQHGSYLLLLLAAYKNAGWLPNDDGMLAQIAKVTPKQWKTERHIYASFFEMTDERWTHDRVTAELEKAERMTERRSKAGSNGAAKRWQTDGKRIAEPSPGHKQTDAPSPSPSPTQDLTNTDQTERGSASAPRTPKPEKPDAKYKLPADWRPDADERGFATDLGLDPDATADVFVDHFTVRKGKTERRDAGEWNKRWKIWCRADASRSGPVGTRPARAAQPPRGNEAFYDELAAISHRSRTAGEPVGRQGQPAAVEPRALSDETWQHEPA